MDNMDFGRILFYDVDTQRDFLLPGGCLYVPGAERILPALSRLYALARKWGIRIVASVDRHFPGDEELERNGGAYPDHCMDGTDGQRKVDETPLRDPQFVENRPLEPAELRRLAAHRGDLVIEKQRFDVFTGNCNAEALLGEILRAHSDVVVFGVVTEVCVDFAVRGLRRLGAAVTVVADAIAELDATRGECVRQEWKRLGVRMITLDELEKELAHKARAPEAIPLS